MKALTLWQPWATLVVEGAKPFEFRKWRSPEALTGQRIVIHASAKRPDPREVAQLIHLLEAGGKYAAATTLVPIDRALEILRRGEWPLAAGVGTALVGEPRSGADLAADFGVVHVNDSGRRYHSTWGWSMLDVEQWEAPLPMRGALGLWRWPEPGDVL